MSAAAALLLAMAVRAEAPVAESLTVGELTLHRCGTLAWCGTLPRALDPTGAVPGTVPVVFEFYPHSAATSAGVLVATGFFLAGKRFLVRDIDRMREEGMAELEAAHRQRRQEFDAHQERDVARLAEQIVVRVKREAAAAGIDLDIEVEEELPPGTKHH